jgi:hypothetical protein
LPGDLAARCEQPSQRNEHRDREKKQLVSGRAKQNQLANRGRGDQGDPLSTQHARCDQEWIDDTSLISNEVAEDSTTSRFSPIDETDIAGRFEREVHKRQAKSCGDEGIGDQTDARKAGPDQLRRQ